MAVRNWNPKEPYVLGLEWPGMRSIPQPLSQDVELGYTFQANATETIDSARFEILPPSVPTDARNTALVTVYQRDSNDPDEGGDELEYGVVTSELCPVNGGAVAGGASLVGGATVADCLVTPSDANYVHIDASGETVTIEFDTTGRFVGKRILEVKAHFVARAIDTGDPEQATAPTAFMGLWDGAAYTDGGIIFIDAYNVSPTLRVESFGEVNYDSGVLPLCWPWTPTDMVGFDTGALSVRFTMFSGDADYKLHYVVLEVVWCEENRQAVGALLLGSETAIGESPMAVGRHEPFLRTPGGVDNWGKTLDAHYAITLTSARSSTLNLRRTKGAVPIVPVVDRFAVFDNHQGRFAPRRISNVLASADADTRLTPIALLTTGATTPTDFNPYDRPFGAPIYNGSGDHGQEIEQRSGGGTVDYPWIRFYARIIGDPTDVPAIDITTVDGAMNYFATSLLLLDEIYDGWREVTLRWPAGQEPAIDNTGANKLVQFSTTQGNLTNRWEILGLDSEFVMLGRNGNATYGQADSEYQVSGVLFQFRDLAVTLHTAVPAPTTFTSSLFSAALGPVCGDTYEDTYSDIYAGGPCSDTCKPDRFDAPLLTWDASTLGDAFGYYEIQRQDTLDPTWRTIAKLTDADENAFTDMEARVGVLSTYQVRQCRDDGICSDWAGPTSQTVPVFDAPCGTLYFSSNAAVAEDMWLGYTEVFDGDPVEPFSFVEAEAVRLQRMYGRFGTQSFHPTERGGVRFERDVLVNAITVPATQGSDGFTLLRDLAWADLPYVCVKDDLGNRWFATLIVPSGMWQRAPQLYIASIQVIESTNVPYPVTTQT